MESILLIEFIKPQDFYDTIFEDWQYKIVGKDDVGNNLDVLVNQLALYKKYGEKSEEDWEKCLPEFRESIMNFGCKCFSRHGELLVDYFGADGVRTTVNYSM